MVAELRPDITLVDVDLGGERLRRRPGRAGGSDPADFVQSRGDLDADTSAWGLATVVRCGRREQRGRTGRIPTWRLAAM
jgi:hypothetical protein